MRTEEYFVMDQHRRIHALLFDVEHFGGQPSRGTIRLIAWFDDRGESRFCRHAHPEKTLLDAEAGHVIVHRRRTHYRVRRVKPYRTSECKDETQYRWRRSVAQFNLNWLLEGEKTGDGTVPDGLFRQ